MHIHNSDVIVSNLVSQITRYSLFVLLFVQTNIKENINARVTGLVYFPQTGPVMRKLLPFDDIILQRYGSV